MTKLERAEKDILDDAKLVKDFAKQMKQDGLWTAEEAGEYLNARLVKLQKKWFELHHKPVGD